MRGSSPVMCWWMATMSMSAPPKLLQDGLQLRLEHGEVAVDHRLVVGTGDGLRVCRLIPIDGHVFGPYARGYMRRRAIIAVFVALEFFTVGLAHSAFACTAAVHAEMLGRTAHSAPSHDCDGDDGLPCCRQPEAMLAAYKLDRPVDDVRIAAASVAAYSAPFVFHVAPPRTLRVFAGLPIHPPALRMHLLLGALLL
jgi:hypothetical protein